MMPSSENVKAPPPREELTKNSYSSKTSNSQLTGPPSYSPSKHGDPYSICVKRTPTVRICAWAATTLNKHANAATVFMSARGEGSPGYSVKGLAGRSYISHKAKYISYWHRFGIPINMKSSWLYKDYDP